MKKKIINISVGIITMLIALYLYVKLRDDTYINTIVETLIQHKVSEFDGENICVRIFSNWGFDIVWSFSFTMVLSGLINLKHSTFIVLLAVFATEFLQLINHRFGTFDIIDIIVEVLGITVSIIVNKITLRKEKLNG